MESNKPITLQEIANIKRAGYSAFAVINGCWYDIDLNDNKTTNRRQAADMVRSMILGKEIVVISGNPDYNSAIMWLEGATRYTTSRELGTVEVPFDRTRLEDHFCSILDEGGHLFARGYKD